MAEPTLEGDHFADGWVIPSRRERSHLRTGMLRLVRGELGRICAITQPQPNPFFEVIGDSSGAMHRIAIVQESARVAPESVLVVHTRIAVDPVSLSRTAVLRAVSLSRHQAALTSRIQDLAANYKDDGKAVWPQPQSAPMVLRSDGSYWLHGHKERAFPEPEVAHSPDDVAAQIAPLEGLFKTLQLCTVDTFCPNVPLRES